MPDNWLVVSDPMKLEPGMEFSDHRSQITSCHFCLNVHQSVVKRAQAFRKDPGSGDDRHEIRITTPARHDMNMQMIENTCARAFANIQANVKPLRSCRGAQKRLGMHDQIPKLDDFVLAER